MNSNELKRNYKDYGKSDDNRDRVSIIFTLKNQIGNLAKALQIFQELGINVLYLELSPVENLHNQANVLVDVECGEKQLDQVMHYLSNEVKSLNYTSIKKNHPNRAPSLSACSSFGNIPFPRSK